MEYVLNGATLIDGNGGEPIANSAVYVQGKRIAWVGSAAAKRALLKQCACTRSVFRRPAATVPSTQ